MSIRIIVADDHEVVRAGLRGLTEGTDISVIAEAKNGDEALRLALEHKPDLLVLDVRLPKNDGLSALGRLRTEYPELPVLMFSSYDNPTYIARDSALGACGFVLKGTSGDTVLQTIRQAARGENAWKHSDLRNVTGGLATPTNPEDDVGLTRRESEVLRQLSFGLTNKEIASALGISYETVKEHVQHILRKIGVTDRTQAAVWAVRRGLV